MSYLPSIGQVLELLLLFAMIYWGSKAHIKAHEENEKRHQEEKAYIEEDIFLNTSRATFKRHLEFILDQIASYKLQHVIITDEKQIPQSVLLPYAEYKLLQECYDKVEAKEVAPLIEERMKKHQEGDNILSYEEMMQKVHKKRAHQRGTPKDCDDPTNASTYTAEKNKMKR